MNDCNPSLVPMIPADQHLTCALVDEQLNDWEYKPFQSILGSLRYLMNCSRPDLAYPIHELSQFSSAPASRHILALKRVLWYLKGTTNARLLLAGLPTDVATPECSLPAISIHGWFDSSWANNVDDSRSTFGYTIMYRRTALLWKSKKHKSVTLSTTDAEYLAATEITTRELCFVQNWFQDLQVPFPTYVLGCLFLLPLPVIMFLCICVCVCLDRVCVYVYLFDCTGCYIHYHDFVPIT